MKRTLRQHRGQVSAVRDQRHERRALSGSTVGEERRTTRYPRYAKRLQLGRGVSEDGDFVVLIHKQLLSSGYRLLMRFRWRRCRGEGVEGGEEGRRAMLAVQFRQKLGGRDGACGSSRRVLVLYSLPLVLSLLIFFLVAWG